MHIITTYMGRYDECILLQPTWDVMIYAYYYNLHGTLWFMHIITTYMGRYD